MKTTGIRAKLKQIEDLKLHEFDMVYSLCRIGWSYAEIGRRYGITESDVKKIVENYAVLRRTAKTNLSDEGLRQDSAPELTKKGLRKRRSDAQYATARERQAAYRARLKERRLAGMQVSLPNPVTDSPAPVEEGLSITTVDIP